MRRRFDRLGESAQDSPDYDPYTGQFLTPTLSQTTTIDPGLPNFAPVDVAPPGDPLTLPDLGVNVPGPTNGLLLLLGALALVALLPRHRGRGTLSWDGAR